MGMVTGALPNGKYAGVALTDGSLSAMPGTDVNGPTALVMSAAKGQDAIKYTATHMNMKLPPDQLKTRKGRDNVLSLVKTYFDNDGYHIQFNVWTPTSSGMRRSTRKTTATLWFGWPVSVHSSPNWHGRAGRGHRTHLAEFRHELIFNGTGTAWRSVMPYRKFLDQPRAGRL